MAIERRKLEGLLSFTIIIIISVLNLAGCSSGTTTTVRKLSVGRTLQDLVAPHGSLFNFTIPADAFNGPVESFEVTEAGSDSLPDWLSYDNVTKSLSGVPDSWRHLLIPRYHVWVVARGGGSDDQKAEQVFTVTVVEDGASTSSAKKGGKNNRLQVDRQKCYYSDKLLSVLIFPVLVQQSDSPVQKSNFISKAARAFNTSVRNVKLLDTTFVKDFADLNVIQSLKSETYDLSHSRPCLLIVVGCHSSGGLQNPTEKLHDYYDASVANELVPPATGRHEEEKEGEERPSALLIEARLANRKTRLRRRRENAIQAQDPQFFTTQETDQPTSPTTPLPTTVKKARSTRIRRPLTSATSSSSRRTRTTATPFTTRLPSTDGQPTRLVGFSSPSIKTTKTFSPTHLDSPSITQATDERPSLKYSLDTITCYQHVLCSKKIGKYTFYDKEDGSTDKLHLKLKIDKTPPGAKKWLVLKEDKQELVGIPMQVGTWHMQITATDKVGNAVTDEFQVVVVPKVDVDNLNHEFYVTLDLNADDFANDVDRQVKFVQRLAQNFGDQDASNVSLNSMATNVENPSTLLIRWSNVSLADTTDPAHCPRQEVDFLLKSQQLPLFRDRMDLKDFPFISVMRNFSQRCGGFGRTPTAVRFPEPSPDPSGAHSKTPSIKISRVPLHHSTSAPDAGGSGSALSVDNWFLAAILPVIIILTLLCLALAIAFVLYRKNKRAKKSAGLVLNGADSRSEFVSKGAPVIFPDEVEQTEDVLLLKSNISHTPMLLKDEKPPLAPPDFALLNGFGRPGDASLGDPSSPGDQPVSRGPASERSYYASGYQSPLSIGRQVKKPPTTGNADEAELTSRPLLQDFDENPMYRAPPPFEPAGLSAKQQQDGRSPRPKHTSPSQREPPPYVPP